MLAIHRWINDGLPSLAQQKRPNIGPSSKTKPFQQWLAIMVPSWKPSLDLQSLRSASTNCLVVPPFKLSTIGSRTFPVAGPQVWNSLPENMYRLRRWRPSVED